jgi:hypothetical protein
VLATASPPPREFETKFIELVAIPAVITYILLKADSCTKNGGTIMITV